MIRLIVPLQKISAYIDAGTATLIVQFLIAGALAGLCMLKVFWGKVKVFFTNLFKKDGK